MSMNEKIKALYGQYEKILQNYEIHGEIHVDPTMLLTKKEWEEIIEIPNNDDYIFLYFLNEPSKLAIQHIKKIIQDNPIEDIMSVHGIFFHMCGSTKVIEGILEVWENAFDKKTDIVWSDNDDRSSEIGMTVVVYRKHVEG